MGGDWLALSKSAKLKVDPRAALDAAKSCNDMIQELEGYQKIFGPASLAGGTSSGLTRAPFGNLDSGERLANAFNKKSTEIYDQIEKHIKNLSGFIDLFKDAGDRFEKTEDYSEADLTKIKGEIGSVDPTPAARDVGYKPGDPHRGGKGEKDDSEKLKKLPDGLSKGSFGATAVGDPTISIPTESPGGMSAEALVKLQEDIKPDPIGEGAKAWGKMAARIETGIYNLNNELSEITAERWKGYAAESARKTVSEYAQSMTVMRGEMDMMRLNHEYTVEWLEETKTAMPSRDEQNYTCKTCRENELPNWQGHFKDIYVAGLKNTEKSFPKVADPPTVPAPTGPPTGSPTGPPTGPPTGSPTGPPAAAPPSTHPSQPSGGPGPGPSPKTTPPPTATQPPSQPPSGHTPSPSSPSPSATPTPTRPPSGQPSQPSQPSHPSPGPGQPPSPGTTPGPGQSQSPGQGGGQDLLGQLMGAITQAVPALAQTLPQLVQALEKLNPAGLFGQPDFRALGGLFDNYPDVKEALAKNPELRALIERNPALKPFGDAIGIGGESGARAAGEDGRPAWANADGKAGQSLFPRASIPGAPVVPGLAQFQTSPGIFDPGTTSGAGVASAEESGSNGSGWNIPGVTAGPAESEPLIRQTEDSEDAPAEASADEDLQHMGPEAQA
ncbi:hypothetical protein AB0H76_37145 [Nocardia sp. NPDC050712]|uniref:PPE domain-containing protein n=1 Tax=Nocardia sp. NPDC050712 TaxID=3155518 RepID=UPI0033F6594C